MRRPKAARCQQTPQRCVQSQRQFLWGRSASTTTPSHACNRDASFRACVPPRRAPPHTRAIAPSVSARPLRLNEHVLTRVRSRHRSLTRRPHAIHDITTALTRHHVRIRFNGRNPSPEQAPRCYLCKYAPSPGKSYHSVSRPPSPSAPPRQQRPRLPVPTLRQARRSRAPPIPPHRTSP